MEIRFTLVGDGPFDCALVPVIYWTLRQHTEGELAGEFAVPHRLPPLSAGLESRVRAAFELYPCNLLFVHRDAEGQGRERRVIEIQRAVKGLRCNSIPVVPVRMTEAWLLISETAIRSAAGNPNGAVSLNLPPLNRLESRPDPKSDLHQALVTASMLSGRSLRRFDKRAAARLVAERIDDFSSLRQLGAFRDFEADLKGALGVV